MATATKETVVVTVEGVSETGRNGFWEMEVTEYDEPLATKEQKLIDILKGLSQGQQAQVEMGVKQNGDFTNRYLNNIQLTGDAVATPSPDAPSAVGPSKKDEREATQRRIEAQWAYGRSVELAITAGFGLDELLDTDTFGKVQAVAEILHAASRDLANKS